MLLQRSHRQEQTTRLSLEAQSVRETEGSALIPVTRYRKIMAKTVEKRVHRYSIRASCCLIHLISSNIVFLVAKNCAGNCFVRRETVASMC